MLTLLTRAHAHADADAGSRIQDERGQFGRDLVFHALRAFAEHFFQCDVCRAHFIKMLNESSLAATANKQDMALWLWQAHNQVRAGGGGATRGGGRGQRLRPGVTKG